MKKKIIIIISIVIISIIPFLIFNDKPSSKNDTKIKKSNISPVESNKNIKKEMFKYITIGHDNINSYIKEEQVEKEKIIYVCIE